MTVLSACQEAALELNQSEPSSLFSTTESFERELALQANRAAVAIAQIYDWQQLTTLGTLTGDGTKTAFDLPDDYDRMPKKMNVSSANWQTASFRPARDLDQWLDFVDTGVSGAPGTWIIYGGQFRIFPAMSATETARFFYISNLIAVPATGSNKTSFTDDNDSFRLSERLLALGVVWRWRAMKRMEYAEDLQSFEIALGEEIIKNKGSKILTVGRVRVPLDTEFAFPGVLGP